MVEPVAEFDFAEVPVLETERLRLRRIREKDCTDWYAVWNSPHTLDYLIDFESAPGEDMMQEIVDWAERIFAEKTGIRWAITFKPDDRMIGSCGFHLYSAAHRRLEIGYELHSYYWRRGIMSEAVSAVLSFCFDSMTVHRIEANVTEGNVASAALLKKLGFGLEGQWRDREFWRGGFHSLWQFGLLAPDYRAMHRCGSAG